MRFMGGSDPSRSFAWYWSTSSRDLASKFEVYGNTTSKYEAMLEDVRPRGGAPFCGEKKSIGQI